MSPTIDFQQLRPHRGDQATGFEELTRQLVLAEALPDVREIEHRGPGADGGVEVLVRFNDGSSWGWQSKWFDSLGVSQVNQLKESFQSAIKNFGPDDKGRLTRFIVALPLNLSGPGTADNSDETRRWASFLAWTKKESVKAIAREVEIQLWDETALISRLQKHDGPYPGILAYWFDRSVFTVEWFRKQLDSAIAALDERYHPEDHVDVRALRVFDVVLHRELVRKDLHRDFAEARAIHPVAADVGGEGIPLLDDIALTQLNETLAQFTALEAAVDRPAIEVWPVYQWRQVWETLVFERLPAVRDKLNKALEAAGHDWNSDRQRRLRDHLGLDRREVFGSPWHWYFEVEEKSAVLFVGEAGIGKSHLLAKAAEDAIANGFPVLLLLGQDFTQANPRTSILDRLDLRGRSFETLLGALDAAAIAANSRALILIDALNEGCGLEIWPKELGRFIEEARRFPRLVLGVSCRSEYLDATIPAGVQSQFLHIDVRGFERFAEQEQAAQVYLDRRGIVRPASPSLDPEFTNPFFLRIAAESLLRAGQHTFPRGLRGAKQVFRFVFETRGRFLGAGRDGTNDLVSPLIQSLQDLAGAMAAARQDYLSIAQATSIINNSFAAYPSTAGRTWLDILRGNGFLRKDISARPEADEFSPRLEVIRFTFQRLADHLMADALLLRQVADIDEAFVQGGPLAFVIQNKLRKSGAQQVAERYISVHRNWSGLCAALWIGIAEGFGRELIDLPGVNETMSKEEVRWIGFQEPFRESLRWRVPSAFSQRTRDVAKWFFDDFARERLPLYLEMALVPKHPWNIENLHGFLINVTMPQRDAHWSSAFAHAQDKAYRNARRIVDWCQNADLSRADEDTIRLATVTLGWLLTVSNRHLRDRATKALATIFYDHPDIIERTLRSFATVDDEYVRERIFAAAYGAVLHLRSQPEILSACAKAAFDVIFNQDQTCRHMTLRDYARGVVEVAAARNVLPTGVDLVRCRPPYRSPLITKWPSAVEVKRLTEERQANRIFSSTVGWVNEDSRPTMAGDFGRYTMSGIGRAFSERPKEGKEGEVPDSPARRKSAFWQEVCSIKPSMAALVNRLLRAHEELTARKNNLLLGIEIKEGDSPEIVFKRWNEEDPGIGAAISEFADVEARFTSGLPDSLRHRYETGKFLPEFGDERPDRFDLVRAQCWVAWRTLDLGWNSERHGKTERGFPDILDRIDHSLERIGKKYQWIAYNELCGYLIDHHWYLPDSSEVASCFNWVDQFDHRDIDPTVWLDDVVEIKPDSRIPRFTVSDTDFGAEDVDSAIAWTKTFNDLLEPLDVIEAVDDNGRQWWTAHLWYRDKGYLDKHQTTDAFRTAQAAINMIFLQQDDIDKFVQAARGRNFGNDNMLRGGETAAIFVGEHAWDSGVLESSSRGRINLTEQYHGIPYCVPTVRLGTKRGEYDSSSTIDRSITSPNADLVRLMRLHVEGPKAFTFVTSKGEPVFIDVKLTRPDVDQAIIQSMPLEAVLAEQGLCPLWIFWSEKDGGKGHGPHFEPRHGEFSRTVFGGCYWRSNGSWQTSGLWLVDRD